MTRLLPRDIDNISADLAVHNRHLISATGYSLFELGCKCWGVIPVTSGLGIITSFSDTVAGILQCLGFKAQASTATDEQELPVPLSREWTGLSESI